MRVSQNDFSTWYSHRCYQLYLRTKSRLGGCCGSLLFMCWGAVLVSVLLLPPPALKYTQRVVRNSWGNNLIVIGDGGLANTFYLLPLIETPFWDVKEGSSVKWKISRPWHVVTLTFMVTLIDVLDDTVQNSLPSNLGHCSQEKKKKKRHGGGVEAASLLT